ncbi:uncharacterized protein AMSG_00939 [Thecamonas trahens ATCC 50062]|uniref:FAM50A/XAP5 C-terminal domain-containing protein n=1 Tax=Thecamonas trahens ATCC 50062 TaxID=461836 RepID=A0A0L0DIK0_THETB|nr:hypothetical protein AMSG_00939 [Thecamonas trahens ATCC 50062]KNC52112.1 hypothetical protein AMSG_00939 [Thecamonas trahens ATCC 50062]|eukprot:XP_013762116.1 hypothetical protein AMSG_00939 [Thecamonas trahens ATCC 50062]
MADPGTKLRYLEKKRAAEAARVAEERQTVAAKVAKATAVAMAAKFTAGGTDAAGNKGGDDGAPAKAYGLLTADELRKEREAAEAAAARKRKAGEPAAGEPKKKKKRRRKKAAAGGAPSGPPASSVLLSFAGGDDDDGDDDGPAVVMAASVSVAPPPSTAAAASASSEAGAVRPKIRKNPNVNTEFLPDAERDAAEQVERERIAKEWLAEQDKVKKEKISIVYSYWDGAGHRREVTVTKGTTIRKFLTLVRNNFDALKLASPDQLLYIKEDVIIPHHYTFYDLIATQARGKSGPLFQFDVHDDVRLVLDARVEKDESHAGKVVLRRWYDANKHTFPASRWEVYDPKKNYGRYTIRGNH